MSQHPTPYKTDLLHRFVFDHTAVRGNHVNLTHTMTQALLHHQYPHVLKEALSQLMVASALLSATLKLQGALILQIQGKGALKLLVVECNSNLEIRATAKWQGDIEQLDFLSLIQDGQFVITLDNKQENGQTYQGIVPIEGATIAEILQNYMQRSEQIETRLWLACDEHQAAGMLLQKLPEQLEIDQDAWNRVCHLADTTTSQELLSLDSEALLHRLFHEEQVRLFDGQATRFNCSCSRQKVGNMLRMLGAEEINQVLAEQAHIEVRCDFCNQAYVFDQVDAAQLLAAETAVSGSKLAH